MFRLWRVGTDIILSEAVLPDTEDVTNIANWIGVYKKNNLSYEFVENELKVYINSTNLDAYDSKWLTIAQSIFDV